MIDAEVSRLRSLRVAALRARALADVLADGPTAVDSVFARTAVVCWSIARLTSGRLKAHPYLNYQKGPSALREALGHLLATLTGFVARKQGKTSRVFAEQLELLARELDDVRALTWSGDLSDALGRARTHLYRLRDDVAFEVRRETGAMAAIRIEAQTAAEPAQSNWPYLAI
jgi:hypothetical protein